jgi:ubiquinol-cytochrome c reductase cytochrome b subunit
LNSLRLIINKLRLRFGTSNIINIWWVYRSGTAIFIVVQVFSRLLLSIYILLHMNMSFDTVELLIEENIGTHYLRFIHANVCSIVFFVILFHIGKRYFIASYTKSNLWKSGTLLLILVIGSAFLGYVIPWGNISLWRATVITNLLSVLPYGDLVLLNVWRRFTLNSATLRRIFSLHFLLPLVVIGLIVAHLILLHEYISSSSIGSNLSLIIFDNLLMKDLMVWIFYFLLLILLIVIPQYFMDADNWGEANFLVTPDHIKPEWYFLFAYAILRCIPVKWLGVLRLVGSLILVILLRTLNMMTLSLLFLGNFLLLTWLGRLEVNDYYTLGSQLSSMMYVSTL